MAVWGWVGAKEKGKTGAWTSWANLRPQITGVWHSNTIHCHCQINHRAGRFWMLSPQSLRDSATPGHTERARHCCSSRLNVPLVVQALNQHRGSW